MFHCTNFKWLVVAYSTGLIWQNWNIIVMWQDVLAGSTGFSTISNKQTREKGGIRYSLMLPNKVKQHLPQSKKPTKSCKNSSFWYTVLRFLTLETQSNGVTATWIKQQSAGNSSCSFYMRRGNLHWDLKGTAWKQPVWFKGSEWSGHGELNYGFLAQKQTDETLLTL